MIHIKDSNAWLPHSVHTYTDPTTGLSANGPTIQTLVERMTAVLKGANQPVPPDLDQIILREIAKTFPDCCYYTDEEAPKRLVKKHFTTVDVKAFVKAVEGTITSGGVVSQEEAEERTNICMQCPYNVKIGGCEGCSGIANLVFRIIGARMTKNLGHLKQCGICGCSLKAKVWVPQDVVKQTANVQNNINDFPDWCWVRK